MTETQAQPGRTLTEKLLFAGSLIALALMLVKVSVIGYYPSDLPLLLVGFAVTAGLAYAAEHLRRERIRRIDREHGVR